jgi:antitoxin component of MazEF toxin-antitoxin module
MPRPVKVKKRGRSMTVIIPSEFAKVRRIKVGTVIDLDSVRVVKSRRRYKLCELVAQFKSKHHHGESNFGKPVGREQW